MADDSEDLAIPSVFRRAVRDLRSVELRSDLSVREIPAPDRLATHAIAFAADVRPDEHTVDSEHGTGRFVLLYDAAEPDAWGGPFRVVCFAQAPLETDIGLDPFVAEVAWSWLVDALESAGAEYTSASGTATKLISQGFGELSGGPDGAQIELRASWSPLSANVGVQFKAWGELLCMLAGLPPQTDGVTPIRWGVARG